MAGVILTICAFTIVAQGVDPQRVLQSAVLPGMGQLGDDQTIKGLAFMAGEVTWVTLAVSQFASSNAYARETEYLRIQYTMAEKYAEKQQFESHWDEAYQKSKKAKTLGLAFLGGAVAWWGLNIFDAIFLPPRSSHSRLKDEIEEHLVVALGKDHLGLRYNFEF